MATFCKTLKPIAQRNYKKTKKVFHNFVLELNHTSISESGFFSFKKIKSLFFNIYYQILSIYLWINNVNMRLLSKFSALKYNNKIQASWSDL